MVVVVAGLVAACGIPRRQTEPGGRAGTRRKDKHGGAGGARGAGKKSTVECGRNDMQTKQDLLLKFNDILESPRAPLPLSLSISLPCSLFLFLSNAKSCAVVLGT